MIKVILTNARVLTPIEYQYLELALRMIPEDMLMNGTGLFYMHQNKIGPLLQRSVATVRRIELSLERKGLIMRLTAANGRRSGQDRLGISLTPLVEALPQLQRRIEQLRLHDERLRAVKAKIHELRRTIFGYLKAGLPSSIQARVARAFSEKWSKEVGSLSERAATAQLRHLKALILWIERKISTSVSDGPSENERSYTEEENILNRKIAERAKRERAKTMAKKGVLNLYRIATPMMREYIEIYYDRNPGQIVQDMGAEIGIPRDVLNHALAVMGPEKAFQSLLVTDCKRHDPVNPVRNPTAYLMKFCKLFSAGALKLDRSLKALQGRPEWATASM